MKDGAGERTHHQLSPTQSLAAAKMLTVGDVNPCLLAADAKHAGGASVRPRVKRPPGSSDDRALLL